MRGWSHTMFRKPTYFNAASNLGPTFGEFVTDQESIFERLARADTPRKTSIVDHGNPGQWHGSKADTAIGCKSDAEVSCIQMDRNRKCLSDQFFLRRLWKEWSRALLRTTLFSDV